MVRVEEADYELSNGDVILAKPGTVIRKTWRIRNMTEEPWEPDTRIVSVTEGLCFEAPEMKFPTPGNKMDISVKIYIPDNSPRQDFIFQYIMRLFNTKLKCFGEPLIATV